MRTPRDIKKANVYALIVEWHTAHPTLTSAEIGVEVGRSASTVSKVLKQRGFPPAKRAMGTYKRLLHRARDNPQVLFWMAGRDNYKRQVEHMRSQADEIEGRDKWLIKYHNQNIWVAYC